MILVLLGPPGAGKGTQAPRLCAEFILRQLSSGDVLRAEKRKGTPLGDQVAWFMVSGNLVPDAIVTEVMLAQLKDPAGRRGFLLDGFPRTATQAESLDKSLRSNGKRVNLVLSLQVADEEIVERITGRRICPTCDRVYHLRYHPPAKPDICDVDQTPLILRDDDTVAVVARRLATYHEMTKPLEMYYREQGVLVEVDAAQSPDEVFARMIEIVRGRWEGGS